MIMKTNKNYLLIFTLYFKNPIIARKLLLDQQIEMKYLRYKWI